jgi:hypothetical protein
VWSRVRSTAELFVKLQHFMWPNIYYIFHKTLPLDHPPRQSKPRILALWVQYIPTYSDIIQRPKSDWRLQIISHLHDYHRMCYLRFSFPTFLCKFALTFAQLAHCRNTSSKEQVMSELIERLYKFHSEMFVAINVIFIAFGAQTLFMRQFMCKLISFHKEYNSWGIANLCNKPTK